MAKKPKSDVTKRNQRLSALFFWLSVLVMLAPVLAYTIIGFVNGAPTQKATLGITLSIAAILFIINMVFKYHIRSVLWILVLGIYFCIDSIMPLLLMVAVGTILDEFVLTPLHKSFKNKAKINREIDKRLP